MNHLSEEELILHYYAEEGDTLGVEHHLEECASCRESYGALQRVLNLVEAAPVPERGPEYGAELWARVAPQLPRRRWSWLHVRQWRWAMAAAAAMVLLSMGFFAGRFYPGHPQPQST